MMHSMCNWLKVLLLTFAYHFVDLIFVNLFGYSKMKLCSTEFKNHIHFSNHANRLNKIC